MSMRGIRTQAAAAELDAFRREHPHGVHARMPESLRVERVALDGRDVTKLCQWADPIVGEVGMYPAKPTADGQDAEAIETDEIVRRSRAGLPVLDVLRGRVEIAYRDDAIAREE